MNKSKLNSKELAQRELLRVSTSLCVRDNQTPLARALRRSFPDLSYAFLLQQIPEQAEDIYWLLVSQTEISKIEIERNSGDVDGAVLVEIVDVKTYQRGRISRQTRERLEVALDLARELNTSKILNSGINLSGAKP